MVTYPAFKCYAGSVLTPSQKAADFVDGAGGAHVYWPAQKARFTLKHILNASDDATLRALFAANQLLAMSLVWYEDGLTYTVKFLEQPKRDAIAGIENEFRNVTVELGEA